MRKRQGLRIPLAATSLMFAGAGEAVAQAVNPGLQPPVLEAVENGVDMLSGTLAFQQTDLQLGQQDSPNFMQLNRTYRSSVSSATGYASFGSWEHNYKLYIIDASEGSHEFDVVIGQQSYSFRSDGGGIYTNLKGDGGKLTLTGSIWTFTASDGSVVTFAVMFPIARMDLK